MSIRTPAHVRHRAAPVDAILVASHRPRGWARAATALLAVLCVGAAACSPAAPPSPTAAKPVATTGSTAAPAPSAAAQPSAAASSVPAVPSPSLIVPSPAASAAAKPSAGSAAGIPAFDEQAVANFYRGKTIRLIVGFGAGGGYDTYARLISKYMGKYIPGNPTIIVENLTGSGSVVALSQIYNTLPKDGTVIGSGDGTLSLQEILGTTTFDFDNSKWQYVGAPSIYEYFWVVSKAGLDRAGITKVEDNLGPNGKQLIAGQTGPGVGLTAQLLLQAIAGANIKTVPGYAGTAQMRLAMDSGEIDGIFTSWDSIKVTEATELANGSHVLFVQFPKDQVKGTPYPVRSAWEFAKTPEDQQMLQYGAIATHEVARAWVMAPGNPADRVAAIQSAFLKALADPDLLADAQKAQLDVNPRSGPELNQIIGDFYKMPEEVKARLKTAVNVPS